MICQIELQIPYSANLINRGNSRRFLGYQNIRYKHTVLSIRRIKLSTVLHYLSYVKINLAVLEYTFYLLSAEKENNHSKHLRTLFHHVSVLPNTFSLLLFTPAYSIFCHSLCLEAYYFLKRWNPSQKNLLLASKDGAARSQLNKTSISGVEFLRDLQLDDRLTQILFNMSQ